MRRSSRGVTKAKKKYQEFDSDDDEAKLAIFEDSGSDFEDDLKKGNNIAGSKMVIKDPSSSEGSSGEDEEDIEAMSFKPKNTAKMKNPVQNPAKKKPGESTLVDSAVSSFKSLNNKREKLLQIKTKKKQVKSSENQKSQCFVPKSSTILHKSLALSESSSSEDESAPIRNPTQILPKFTKLKSKQTSKPILKNESPKDSEDEIDFASQLESLAQNYTLTKTEEKKPSPKKSPLKSSLMKAEPSSSSSAKNIAHLLAQGEGISLSSSENESDENSPADLKTGKYYVSTLTEMILVTNHS